MQATIKATTIQKLQSASKSTKNDKTKQLSEFFFSFCNKNVAQYLRNINKCEDGNKIRLCYFLRFYQ